MEDRESIIQKNIDYLRRKQITHGWQSVLVFVVLLLIGMAYINGFVVGLVFFGGLVFVFYVVLQHYDHGRKAIDAQIKGYEDELEELREARRLADLRERWQWDQE